MGLFGKLFGKNSEAARTDNQLPWIQLKNSGQLDTILGNSSEIPQFIFKHSTTCGISRMVLGMFSNNFPTSELNADLYFLDLHAHRNISNEVASKFQVMHQSPQLIVIKDKKVLFHTSHGAIADVDFVQFQ